MVDVGLFGVACFATFVRVALQLLVFFDGQMNFLTCCCVAMWEESSQYQCFRGPTELLGSSCILTICTLLFGDKQPSSYMKKKETNALDFYWDLPP